ncbi:MULTISPECIES: bifunctional phosphopantothenoylcysteine decarboxylase/phosphopantothenate--cysteine ligase CoaBC [Nonlabens]|uniref:bifunctional phosphopantothenoylcysteine decarboxylase/phosphopantothenate--cysteine ligase CoaBC n=1 Tax=Nonlabens TaxID=363408 RepID=UPI000CF5085E|nr:MULTISPECIES: bifunctional phosphopantothenoylcysteine decarboxylase/phosphopantothenate--cysteine ligase CoaBC [Nonlabens]PQJ17277.1 phosphopantothenoylcysteine decarboxylase [Nonlabens tegetincola]PQJ20988.1 phosphopantothenoylcysteine decarboxylase [Nonlabens tegetincola]
MSILSGKKVLLGVTGGIAAYKTTFLTRLLIKAGAVVKVVMTPAARDFVTPLTLSTLSKNPVHSHFTNEDDENDTWNNHVELGLWADLIIIAPATANTLSKMVSGTIDNLLLAVYCSAKCPVYFAPAMDLDMYKHPSTLHNFEKLESYGNLMIPAGEGELASGLSGKGRMAEPEEIITFVENDILSKLPLHDKKVLITAGPTHEAIDPVRFIGNHSSGKMGAALAVQVAEMGAQVHLIMGPSSVIVEHSLIQRIDVTSARDMYDAVHKIVSKMDIAIFSAAVADYRPKDVASNKIKKKEDTLHIELIKNPDILASVGALKNKPFLVGFALETNDELNHAFAKAEKKNTDLLVLNSMRDKGAGFKKDTNKITLIAKEKEVIPFELKSKVEVAKDIVNEIVKRIK